MGKRTGHTSCPCDSGKSIDDCCAAIIRGEATAKTAEALMRSRYTAYALSDADYLLKTWHPTTRPKTIELDDNIKWLRLKIIKSDDDIVEFIATFRVNGKAHKLHESSRFVQENGQWFYVGGEIG